MIKYFHKSRELTKGSSGASGFDLQADLSTAREINPLSRWKVPTGLYLDMPPGCEAQVRSRSGLSLNHGITVCGGLGTVDSDYRGEVFVTLINLGTSTYTINPGERIAQLVFAPVLCQGFIWMAHENPPIRVPNLEDLSSTGRGESGFGSTGR